ncbi:MAG: Ribonuclease [Candidatus Parcubacteria bacterium]
MPDIRVAAVTPQKVSKTATMRNKIRRKAYEAVRTIKASIKPGVHAAVFAKQTVLNAKQVDIAADIKDLFVKAGLLR